MGVPEVDAIDGLPPAVALQQQRGAPTTRSSVGSVTTLSNLLRMLYSRAGDYPRGQAHRSTPRRSRPTRRRAPARSATGWAGSTTPPSGRWCRTTRSPSASAPSPPGRRRGTARTCATSSSRSATTSTGPGASCRRRTATGSSSPTSSRRCRSTPATRRRRRGARSSARRSRATWARSPARGATCCRRSPPTQSALMKKRVARYLVSTDCPVCDGKRLRPRGAVGHVRRARHRRAVARCRSSGWRRSSARTPTARRRARQALAQEHPEKALVAAPHRQDLVRAARRAARPRPRLPLARAQHAHALARRAAAAAAGTQVRSQPVRRGLRARRAVGRAAPGATPRRCCARSTGSRRRATRSSWSSTSSTSSATPTGSWTSGPAAGEHGGAVLYSGPPAGLARGRGSRAPAQLPVRRAATPPARTPREPQGLAAARRA